MGIRNQLVLTLSLLVLSAGVTASAEPRPELNAAQMQVISSCSQSAGIPPGTPPHQLSAEKRELMRACIQKSGVAIPHPGEPSRSGGFPPRPPRR